MPRKDAKVMREQAAQLAQLYAHERIACGDPEGGDVLLDLAKSIRKIPLYDLH